MYNEIETGTSAIFEYDETGTLIGAAFLRYEVENTDNSDFISEEKALATSYEMVETYTLDNTYFISDDIALDIQFIEATAELSSFQGTYYWYINIKANVVFDERGTVSKIYDVRINAETGELFDMVWSLN